MTDIDWLDRIRTITNMTSELLADVTAGLTEPAPEAETKRELPTMPGTVIRWKDDAYLPHLAQLDPAGRMGWRSDNSVVGGTGNEDRWVSNDSLKSAIGIRDFVVLEPASETASEVITAIASAVYSGNVSTGTSGDFRATVSAVEKRFGVER